MPNTQVLTERWAEFRRQNPKARIRDAASALGVTEVELLATQVGAGVIRLEGDWAALVRELPKLEEVMCLTRNETAVHESTGVFEQVDAFHGMAQVVGAKINLRIFFKHWAFGFAVNDHAPEGDRQSLQFFDAHGDAVHKIYLRKSSNYGAYGVLLTRFRAPAQSQDVEVVPQPSDENTEPPKVDMEKFRAEWQALKDTHGFYPFLARFGVSRLEAMHLAPEGFATEVPVDAAQRLLEAAASSKLPVMVFIGSRGCVQIHAGVVQNIKKLGTEWLNVLDEDFSMHLRLPLVASAWVVRKPTLEGMITSLELFNDRGEDVTIFYGLRHPGQSEDPAWRVLLAEATNTAPTVSRNLQGSSQKQALFRTAPREE